MRIILIGFMGAGKSSVATALAEELHIESIEIDEVVLSISGRKSVRDIFETDSEQVFRELEEIACESLSEMDDVVIATGGGVVLREQNKKALEGDENAVFVYLQTPFDVIWTRISGDGGRPLARDKFSLEQLYLTRLPLYEEWSDLTVQTDHMDINQVVSTITRGISSIHERTSKASVVNS